MMVPYLRSQVKVQFGVKNYNLPAVRREMKPTPHLNFPTNITPNFRSVEKVAQSQVSH